MRWWVLFLIGCAPAPAVKWNYGEPWGGQCATGKSQSPIDLHPEKGFAPKVQLEYWPSVGRVVNTGKTIQFDYDRGSTLIVDGKRYALVQIGFHHPGEHLLDGKSFPMELQLLHKSEEGKLAAVGVLITEGQPNRWLQPFFAALPNPGETREPGARINAANLMPAKRTFVHYSGSLTTPPCSDVEWFVMTTPLEMSAEQIAAFAAFYPDNHRAVQPANGRRAIEGEAQ